MDKTVTEEKEKRICLIILMVLDKDKSGILSLTFGYRTVTRDYERSFERFTCCHGKKETKEMVN